MVFAMGLEFVAVGAVVGAVRKSELGSSLGSRLQGALASTYSYVVGDEDDAAESLAEPSPVRMVMNVRPQLLPELRGPHEISSGTMTVLAQPGVLEQLAAAAPRRYGDTGSAWHLVFHTSLHGTSLAHMLRRASGCGPCFIIITDADRRT